MAKRLTTEEFVARARAVHGNKYDYGCSSYVDSRTNVSIRCPKHGIFEQRGASHLQGNGCPACAREWSDAHRDHLRKSSRQSRGMTTEEWVARAKIVHGDKYDYSQTEYVNQRTCVKIICPKHGVFEQKADSHIRGFGCRRCGDESDKHKGVHGWSDEQRKKIAETCMSRYGASRYLDSIEGQMKNHEVRSALPFREKMREIISSDMVQLKTKETCLSRYGVEFPMMLSEVADKVGDAKRKNGTWSTSQPEERMYEMLCSYFGDQDIVRQYKEPRYPFHCDFYVRSLDLFIELNATWLHGGHWFDMNCVEDVALLEVWKEKLASGKRFYSVAIEVWTVRDVAKYVQAKEQGLNYLAFWKNDLSDFRAWLDSDPLFLNNISK